MHLVRDHDQPTLLFKAQLNSLWCDIDGVFRLEYGIRYSGA
jgi:hypothetical protein